MIGKKIFLTDGKLKKIYSLEQFVLEHSLRSWSDSERKNVRV